MSKGWSAQNMQTAKLLTAFRCQKALAEARSGTAFDNEITMIVRWLALLLIPLHFAQAQELVPSFPHPAHPHPRYEAMARLTERFWNHPNTIAMAEQLQAEGKGWVYSPDKKFRANVQTQARYETYKIGIALVMAESASPAYRGQRHLNANPYFAQFVAALFRAAQMKKQVYPHLKELIIEGQDVYNHDIFEYMQSLGAESSRGAGAYGALLRNHQLRFLY